MSLEWFHLKCPFYAQQSDELKTARERLRTAPTEKRHEEEQHVREAEVALGRSTRLMIQTQTHR